LVSKRFNGNVQSSGYANPADMQIQSLELILAKAMSLLLLYTSRPESQFSIVSGEMRQFWKFFGNAKHN